VETVRVWFISRGGSGQIITGWERNLMDSGGEDILMHFERPDFVNVNFSPNLFDGALVNKDDTIATVSSQRGLSNYKVIEAELEKARAEHAAFEAGARVEDLEVARQEVQCAEAALETQKYELERAKHLYQSDLIPLANLQLVEGEYRVLEAELEFALANLQALQAGARPEDIEVARVEIERLKRELESAKISLGSKEAIISPLHGKIRLCVGGDYLARIESTDTLAVVMNIPESIVPLVTAGRIVDIKLFADDSKPRTAQIWRTAFFSTDTTGTFAIAIAFLENGDGKVQSGMTGRASFSLGKKTLFEALKSRLTSERQTL